MHKFYTSRWMLFRPFFWVLRKILFESELYKPYRGIVIIGLGSKEASNLLFEEKTKAAIDFLAETDPLRFRRVQRFLKVIILSKSPLVLARYTQPLSGCYVSFHQYRFDDNAAHKIPWYACTLVHESTHGYLHAKHFPYTKKTRERIERCCVKEEWRFAQRFSPDEIDWKSHIWSKVENRAWDPGWNRPYIQKIKLHIQYLKNSR